MSHPNPLGKTFWQTVLISILEYFEVISQTNTYTQEEAANGLSDFILCLEMFLVCFLHHYAFPSREFCHLKDSITPVDPDQENSSGDEKASQKINDILQRADDRKKIKQDERIQQATRIIQAVQPILITSKSSMILPARKDHARIKNPNPFGMTLAYQSAPSNDNRSSFTEEIIAQITLPVMPENE